MEERRARKHVFDDTTIGKPRNAHAVAAGERHPPSLQYAVERFAVIESHRVAAAAICGDESIQKPAVLLL